MMATAQACCLPALLAASLAFANIDLGDALPNPSLAGIDGVEHSLIATGTVSVFVFFHPEQERSREALSGLAELMTDLEGKPVHWTGVVSDRFSADAARSALAEAGLDLPAVVDVSDALYGELGVRLYPTIGVADEKARLHAYLPYTKVNHAASVEAQIRHALGEITDDELQAALRPSEVAWGGNDAAVQRNLRFAEMLRAGGKPEKALEKAREAAELAPGSAEAHAMVGAILVEMGDCDGARVPLQRALELDSEMATASEALESCSSE